MTLRANGCVMVILAALAFGCATTPVDPAPAVPQSWQANPDSTYFIQMSDTQFGMWATPMLYMFFRRSGDPMSFARETESMGRAIALANRLHPDFVIICGDLVNVPGHEGQIAEFKRIAAQLSPEIPFYFVAGNHDVGNEPTAETLSSYRASFGPDYFSFHVKDVYGIVLNSQLIHSPKNVPTEAVRQLAWLREELLRAKASGAAQILVFQHQSFFLKTPDESDGYFNLPSVRRRLYLDLLHDAGVRAVFAGHRHRNFHGFDRDLEMITTGPVGRPMGPDPSGIRVVRVGPGGLEHTYYRLDEEPVSGGAP